MGYLRKRVCCPDGPPRIQNFSVAGDTAEDGLSTQLRRLFEMFPTAESLEDSDRALFGVFLHKKSCFMNWASMT
jgi:hypothetical protein